MELRQVELRQAMLLVDEDANIQVVTIFVVLKNLPDVAIVALSPQQ